MNRPLILASQSPRRKELLSYCNIDFKTIVADVDETIDPALPIIEEIQRLAYKKAKAVLDLNPDSVVIGSDTIVVIDNQILGKPKNEEDAKQMLRLLQGRTHEVITGVCLCSNEKVDSFSHITEVTFFEMSEEEINWYVSTGEPMDKAGAYGIQGKCMIYIKDIKGDYYSVMGLPVSDVYQHLKQF